MSSNYNSREDLGPKDRHRSSSATESSKPTNIAARRQPGPIAPTSLPYTQGLAGNNTIRERCDSMPSRARTTSEGNHIPFLSQQRYLLPHRPISIGSPITPPSAAGSTDSAGSSTSIDDEHWHDSDILGVGSTTTTRCCPHSMTPDEPIAEENGEDMVDGGPYHLHSGSSCVTFIPRQAHTRSDDGYVDMSPSNRNHHSFMSPTASLSSVTSGTPSTDIRFIEYTMDKVSSYLTASEDEGSDRPARAYSFGSRPETGRYRTSQASDAARERAYSFGAKTKKIHGRILPPYASYQHNTGTKSSSAPLLSSYRLQGSHSSLNPLNDDHMELDFSKPVTTNSGYLDMKPGKAPSGYVEMKPGIPPETNHDNKRKPHLQNSLIHKPNRATSVDANKNQDYVDMTAGTSPGKSENYITRSTNNREIPSGYMEMDMAKIRRDMKNRTVSDGAREGVTTTSHQRQTSLDGTDPENSDYTNMSLGSSSSTKKKDRKTNKKDKVRSQPIQIQTTNTVTPSTLYSMAKGPSSSSPLLYSWSGRKYSTGTPPKMCLPLSTSNYGLYSSLPRQRSRKNSRRDSKDSSTSSATTPSSSSTLFPMSLNSPSSPIKTETIPKLPPSTSRFGSNDDYAVMDFCRTKTNTKPESSGDSDYVNYNPAKPYTRTHSADYVPIIPQTTKITKDPTSSNLEGSYRSLENLRSNETESPSGNETGDKAKSRPDSVTSSETGSNLSRPGSTSSELGSTSSTLIGGSSRPPSVGNDPTRPPSTTSNDMQLCYASLELVRSDEDGSRSPRTLKTQTSDGSANSAASSSSGAAEQDTAFTYAKIDFVRSGESFKHNQPFINNAKVKH
ncbi:hypothetical protein MML48_8g00012582 [Holotrichia oblita]|uniref:Uncharacterized protein n=1 Tax=Holotrichia oblita TaxID=644536 RepID=A0ACB9SQV8_HOLOL|nr:hypothetical protein MML48_8g00012582 [Holotrichia oblita]